MIIYRLAFGTETPIHHASRPGGTVPQGHLDVMFPRETVGSDSSTPPPAKHEMCPCARTSDKDGEVSFVFRGPSKYAFAGGTVPVEFAFVLTGEECP